MKQKLVTVIIALTLTALPILSSPVLAQPAPQAPTGNALKDQAQQGVDSVGGQQQGSDLNTVIKDVINIILFVVGAIAVIMIIIGAVRYVLSGGDQNAVAGAKNTIIYSIVGLVIALSAYAIVNFVINKL